MRLDSFCLPMTIFTAPSSRQAGWHPMNPLAGKLSLNGRSGPIFHHRVLWMWKTVMWMLMAQWKIFPERIWFLPELWSLWVHIWPYSVVGLNLLIPCVGCVFMIWPESLLENVSFRSENIFPNRLTLCYFET